MINRMQWLKYGLGLSLAALLLTGCSGAALPSTSWAGLTVDGGVAYLAATNQIVAIDTSNGAERWVFKSEVTQPGLFGSSTHIIPVHAGPAVYGRWVFTGSDGQPRDEGRVRALDAGTGQPRWQFPPEGQPAMGNIFAGLLVQDDVLYLCAVDQVYALKAATGEKLWSVSVGGRVWATPLLAGERLYVSTLNHKLFALDTSAQGKTVWTFEQAQGALAGSPVLDGDTLYVGSFDHRLYAIDAQTGRPRWNHITPGWVWDGLAVISDTVYVGDLSGYVQALSTDDGQPMWSQPTKVDGAVRANPLYAGGNLIVVTDAGNIYALDPGNGSLRWAANAPNSRLLTRPVLESGQLLLATLSGPVQLYSLDLAAMPEAYQRQDIQAGVRVPVALYKESQANADVVRWYYPPASSEGK